MGHIFNFIHLQSFILSISWYYDIFQPLYKYSWKTLYKYLNDKIYTFSTYFYPKPGTTNVHIFLHFSTFNTVLQKHTKKYEKPRSSY